MPHADFIHLRVHTAYSLSEGAIKIKDLVKAVAAEGMPAVAITDTGNLFGALEFALAATDAGVQPIIGAQLALRRHDPSAGRGATQPDPDQLVLLAQNQAGYANLMGLVSQAYLTSAPHEAPQIDLEAVGARAEGLIALTGGPRGLVGRLLGEGQRPAATQALDALASIFPDRLYVELQRHGLAVEDRIEPDLVALAYERGLPLVATNEAFFTNRAMFEAHDALLCIAQGTTVSQTERRRVTAEHWLKPPAAMRALFQDLPEAVDNTLIVARRCAVMPDLRKPILPPFPSLDGKDEAVALRHAAEAGLEARLATGDLAAPVEAYRERLDFELATIVKMGFAGYFLIVADFIQWAKSSGIPVGPGRGSGAGSVVAWALTITDLDPIRFGLLFERFLNPERVSMPDFDIDFCQDRRDEVIRYVQGKYGHDRVAQIITFGKLQARAVLRDVGRVFEMPYGQVDRICKMVPNNPANPVTLQQALDGDPQLRAMREGDEAVAKLIETGLKLEGLYRHASTHAAGVVIADRPLDRLVPLYRDPRSDMPVTQFNMKYVEQAGLVKFDFLGLKTLTVLARTLDLLNRRGIELDLSLLPLDDAKTFQMLSQGEASGVFQLESSGMRDVLRKLRPDRFEDIIAVVALYRPGPMDNIPSYINRKHGTEKPDYLHPKLEGILKETFGIMIYQEQVMQIAQVLSGYSLGGADLLRRAMGKKIKAEMEAQRASFVKGAEAGGVDAATAGNIFDQVEKFAGYGFNKSHAAAYALVSYQTAWLKANHPVEFLAASMTLDMGNTDKLNLFRQELTRLGIRLLPPDINKSRTDFAVEALADSTLAVRYALAAIRNVGTSATDAIVAERERAGPFRDLHDFACRIDPRAVNKRAIENLAVAGAFDALDANRARVSAAADLIIRWGNEALAERESTQVALFGGLAEQAQAPETAKAWTQHLPKLADWSPAERLQKEFEAIGFYLSAHPLDAYRKALMRLGVVDQAALTRSLRNGETRRLKLAGVVLGRQERTSARGNRFAFVQMSDASGRFELMVFAEVLAASRDLLDAGKPLLVTVEAKLEEDRLRLGAQAIELLDPIVASLTAGLQVVVDRPEAATGLRKLLDPLRRHGAGAKGGRVALTVALADRQVEIGLPDRYAVTPELHHAIRALPGVMQVVEL